MRGMVVAACALLALAVTTQRAQAAPPKPQAPPRAHRTAPHPAPWPGASATKSVMSTSSSSASASTSIPAAPHVARAVVVVAAQRSAAPATPLRPKPRTRAKPARDPGLPIGFQDSAGLNELRSVATSGDSALLLVAGLVLLLLVIGETTFLGLAGSRLEVARVRAPVRRPPPEEPLPIRRVQLRR
jgi:hypothetical protein